MVTWGHVGSQGALYWLQLRKVTWGAGAHCIGRCSGWSRDQVTGWVTCRDVIIDLLKACLHYVILVDESIFGRFRSIKGHRSRSRRRRRGGRLCCSLLRCVHISVVLRKTEADYQTYLYNYPINFGASFTLVHHPMRRADDIRWWPLFRHPSGSIPSSERSLHFW